MAGSREPLRGQAPLGPLDAFVADVHPRLVGALSLVCGDAGAAEELAQEALIRVCDRWPAVQRMDNPGGWAYRVGLNLARSRFRRTQAERRALERRRAGEQVAHHDADVAGAVALRAALATLPLRQRHALVLRYYADLPLAEVAQVLEVSEGAVKQLLHRGTTALRTTLGADAYSEASDA